MNKIKLMENKYKSFKRLISLLKKTSYLVYGYTTLQFKNFTYILNVNYIIYCSTLHEKFYRINEHYFSYRLISRVGLFLTIFYCKKCNKL